MDIVTIDFETYYDKDFSLSKMTTESYIRDPRFEVIGVGIKVNNYPTDWYTGSDPAKFLNSLDYKDKAILCHHTAFCTRRSGCSNKSVNPLSAFEKA